ncbi:MAG: AtpZ/AtpI family protein [bacterium]
MLPSGPQKTRDSQKKKLSDRESFLLAFGVYGAVGFQLVAAILVGAFLGQWLDRKWGSSPWLLLVGLSLGCAAGFYQLFRLIDWKNQRKK